MQVGGQSLAHPMPRLAPQEMYAPRPSVYPFHVPWSARSDIVSLISLLPEHDEIMTCLDFFQRRAQSCSFPHATDDTTRSEVERFLLDVERNADCCPDMLALVFILIAAGLQMGQYDASGGRWEAGAVERTLQKADVFGEITPITLPLRVCYTPLPCSGVSISFDSRVTHHRLSVAPHLVGFVTRESKKTETPLKGSGV